MINTAFLLLITFALKAVEANYLNVSFCSVYDLCKMLAHASFAR